MNAEQRRILRRTTQLNGFSLLEVLLVVGILGILAVISFGVYDGFVRDTEINMTAKNIIFDLRQAQAKAMTGEDGRKWGAHFVNSADDYYEIFSTPTDYNDADKTVSATNYLPGAVFFTAPAASSTIIFSKISGTISSESSVIISSPTAQSRTITATAQGNIY